jgi:3-oxoacyl-[acyl-carrier-protein] synthase-3
MIFGNAKPFLNYSLLCRNEKTMFEEFKNIQITAMAACVPKNKVPLSSFGEQFGDTDIARICKSTGIHTVRVAPKNMKTSDLCYAAAEKLMQELEIDRDSIDALVFVSQTPDSLMPATSAKLQHRLQLKKHCLAFDIAYGCSGYVYGLFQASLLLQANHCRRVLLCVGDVITPYLHPGDKNVRLVFGDAGSATLVERGSQSLHVLLKTDGSGSHELAMKNHEIVEPLADAYAPVRSHYLYMNGTAIMDFALREVPQTVQELLTFAGLQKDDIDIFALHQANALMLNYLRKKMGVKAEKVPVYIEDVGNTGPASLPLMFSELGWKLQTESSLKKSMLCGFGVGLSWGAVLCDLSQTVFLPKIELEQELVL